MPNVVKNLMLVSAGLVIGATVRGGDFVPTRRLSAPGVSDDALLGLETGIRSPLVWMDRPLDLECAPLGCPETF